MNIKKLHNFISYQFHSLTKKKKHSPFWDLKKIYLKKNIFFVISYRHC